MSDIFKSAAVLTAEKLGAGKLDVSLKLDAPCRYRFEMLRHPYTCDFIEALNREGVDGLLLWRSTGTTETTIQASVESPSDSFESRYQPYVASVEKPYPKADVDFSDEGAYSIYNWELFFHAPFYIADRLSRNQRFEEALRWFHYIFDPTDASNQPEPQRYWKFLPFWRAAQTSPDDELKGILEDPTMRDALAKAVLGWRNDSFMPHQVARRRTWAYPKAVVMRYIETLLAYGDQLFRRETLESINEATLLYVRAAEILGPRPPAVAPRVKAKVASYKSLVSDPDFNEFGDAMTEGENLLLGIDLGDDGSTGIGGAVPPQTLYFCIPRNEQLLGYWDTVADRLFKIRHCQNIEGVVRQLPLFEPPIDPALLVRAAAMGVDLSSVLDDLNAPLPAYRFPTLLQKAVELCGEVKTLGAAMLAAIEKRDAEALALLRSRHEIDLLTSVHVVKERQVQEAEHSLRVAEASQMLAKIRLRYYTGLEITGLNTHEHDQLKLMQQARDLQAAHATTELLAVVGHFIPGFKMGAPTTIGSTFGGANVGSALRSFGASLGVVASALSTSSSLAATEGGFRRREQEWSLQKMLADTEVQQGEKAIAAAAVRLDIARLELANHDRQLENATRVDEFMRDKFTNRELFDWMASQLATLHFQSYDLAYKLAKRAEKAFQFELGDWSNTFIRFGHWENLRRGLLAGERLHFDLRRMEAAFLEQNTRELEISKHISLSALAPEALMLLKETGQCFIALPEMLFDLDYPGHYFRRVKSVALTLPCVAGPYAGVHCTLTFLRGSLRTSSNPDPTYVRAAPDVRFRDDVGTIQSIVTSTGQNDSGTFEGDERRSPFEGVALVESQWRLELPQETNRWNVDTLSDVVLHVRYTARDGGDRLRGASRDATFGAATPALSSDVPVSALPGIQLFGARRDFSSDWQRFLLQPADTAPQLLHLDLAADRFPFYPRATGLEIDKVTIYVRLAEKTVISPSDLKAKLSRSSTDPGEEVAFAANPFGIPDVYVAEFTGGHPGQWTLSLTSIPSAIAAPQSQNRIDPSKVADCMIMCAHSVR